MNMLDAYEEANVDMKKSMIQHDMHLMNQYLAHLEDDVTWIGTDNTEESYHYIRDEFPTTLIKTSATRNCNHTWLTSEMAACQAWILGI